MSFDSPGYALFLGAVAGLCRLCPGRFRWALLLGASLFFYACWSPPLTLVILGVIGLTYLCGRGIQKAKTKALARLYVGFSLLGCLGLLVYFKYWNFFGAAAAGLLGGRWEPWAIVLPVGCSFYTFQALSYVLDVYRGRIPAVTHPGRYALYIAFFPQLVAGPIERAERLLPQLEALPSPTRQEVNRGLSLLVSGFFRKLVLADLAAPIVNRVFASPAPEGFSVAVGTALFALQIYCDFAGYSEIAQGSALLLGVRLSRNFDRPYLAPTLRFFWRRWHITLSRWFTDYVYIPLGGSRRGKARQIAATLAVFLLSGLWHGANWTFVCWGLWHGVFCALEIALNRRERQGRWAALAQGAVTFCLTLLAWILFRAENLSQAGALYHSLFSPWQISAGLSLLDISWQQAACLALGLCQLPALHRLSCDGNGGENDRKKAGEMTRWFLGACAVIAWFLRAANGGPSAFIYFQF